YGCRCRSRARPGRRRILLPRIRAQRACARHRAGGIAQRWAQLHHGVHAVMSEAVAFLDHAASDAVKDAAGLHIGYLVQQFPPEVGAGPARVVEMAREWLAAGARVTVFTGMPNRP